MSMSGMGHIATCGDHNFLVSDASGFASEETVSTNYGDSEIFKNMDWSMHVFGHGESKEDFLINDEMSTKTSVVFHWHHPANSVFIAGSYDGWKEVTQLKRSHADFYTIIKVPKGIHQYKFLVDGQWTFDRNEPKISHESTGTNNLLEVKSSDCDAFEALAIDSGGFRSGGRNRVPPGPWSRDIPPRQSGGGSLLRTGPPALPPHLMDSILNKETSPSCDPSILQEPTHVTLNHLYTRSIKDGVLVLGTTHRYRKKYITTLLYRPL